MGRLFISLTWCFWLFLNFEEVSGISGRLYDMVSVRNFVFGNRFIAITHMKDIWHDAGDVEEMTLGAAFSIYFKLSRQMHIAYGNMATRVEWKSLEMAKKEIANLGIKVRRLWSKMPILPICVKCDLYRLDSYINLSFLDSYLGYLNIHRLFATSIIY